MSKNGVTASQVQARDFLAARAKDRRAQFQPDGPLVIVSGGQKDWHDFAMIWAILDDIKSRIPNMVLGTTGMRKGVDAMAARIREAATKAGVPLVANPPLARALWRLDVDAGIPAEHYQAVAEIIAYVWRQNGAAARHA